jgi:hypothetical protein
MASLIKLRFGCFTLRRGLADLLVLGFFAFVRLSFFIGSSLTLKIAFYLQLIAILAGP